MHMLFKAYPHELGFRQAGGVEPLVSLLQGASDKRAIKSASWALANLAKSNTDNKAAIREAKGIQVRAYGMILHKPCQQLCALQQGA